MLQQQDGNGIFLRTTGHHGYKWNLTARTKLGIFAAYLQRISAHSAQYDTYPIGPYVQRDNFPYHPFWAPSQYKDRLIYVWRFPC